MQPQTKTITEAQSTLWLVIVSIRSDPLFILSNFTLISRYASLAELLLKITKKTRLHDYDFKPSENRAGQNWLSNYYCITSHTSVAVVVGIEILDTTHNYFAVRSKKLKNRLK